MVSEAGDRLRDICFTGIFVPGLNRQPWQAGSSSRVLTFFQTPELRDMGGRAEFLPLSYSRIAAHYRANPPDAVLFMCAPPDADGFCSLGTECAFVADLWPGARTRIAHINPSMPRTPGHRGVPWCEIDAYVEAEQPLLSVPEGAADPAAEAIARQIAPFIGDGATLQTGLGKVPDAVLDALHDRRNLGLHTGLVGDGAMRLAAAGALGGSGSAIVGAAIGSEALYAAITGPSFDFQPVSVTHDLARLAAYDAFVAINSALEVDLFGQAYAEVTAAGAMSGPGGASEFAMATRASANGLSIVALPATAKNGQISRITAPGRAYGPVSLSRLSIDLVVTEHGVADFRHATHAVRAEQLIAIAAPQFRRDLAASWAEIEKSL